MKKEQSLMNRRMRSYYYAVFGAIGGLVGWQISNLLGLSFTSNIFLNEAVVGALVGLSIGLLIGLAEGMMTMNQSLYRLTRRGAIGMDLALKRSSNPEGLQRLFEKG